MQEPNTARVVAAVPVARFAQTKVQSGTHALVWRKSDDLLVNTHSCVLRIPLLDNSNLVELGEVARLPYESLSIIPRPTACGNARAWLHSVSEHEDQLDALRSTLPGAEADQSSRGMDGCCGAVCASGGLLQFEGCVRSEPGIGIEIPSSILDDVLLSLGRNRSHVIFPGQWTGSPTQDYEIVEVCHVPAQHENVRSNPDRHRGQLHGSVHAAWFGTLGSKGSAPPLSWVLIFAADSFFDVRVGTYPELGLGKWASSVSHAAQFFTTGFGARSVAVLPATLKRKDAFHTFDVVIGTGTGSVELLCLSVSNRDKNISLTEIVPLFLGIGQAVEFLALEGHFLVATSGAELFFIQLDKIEAGDVLRVQNMAGSSSAITALTVLPVFGRAGRVMVALTGTTDGNVCAHIFEKSENSGIINHTTLPVYSARGSVRGLSVSPNGLAVAILHEVDPGHCGDLNSESQQPNTFRVTVRIALLGDAIVRRTFLTEDSFSFFAAEGPPRGCVESCDHVLLFKLIDRLASARPQLSFSAFDLDQGLLSRFLQTASQVHEFWSCFVELLRCLSGLDSGFGEALHLPPALMSASFSLSVAPASRRSHVGIASVRAARVWDSSFPMRVLRVCAFLLLRALFIVDTRVHHGADRALSREQRFLACLQAVVEAALMRHLASLRHDAKVEALWSSVQRDASSWSNTEEEPQNRAVAMRCFRCYGMPQNMEVGDSKIQAVPGTSIVRSSVCQHDKRVNRCYVSLTPVTQTSADAIYCVSCKAVMSGSCITSTSIMPAMWRCPVCWQRLRRAGADLVS
ncbi:hypothetical protein FVE85_6719 [Porphyridium purpureum]|uniref:Uncharacterized protein n=1 Tax=Porphyridium purpureum TaxID=35688 RepID=A0A5J4Z7Z7_PORPP|nr:hypothetical protein FVE85_6719 [Porphyridium purpureum]|eukprot:POR6455..scf295_1